MNNVSRQKVVLYFVMLNLSKSVCVKYTSCNFLLKTNLRVFELQFLVYSLQFLCVRIFILLT